MGITQVAGEGRSDRTADWVLIAPGLAVWNYDYRLDEVIPFLHEDNGNGWYRRC